MTGADLSGCKLLRQAVIIWVSLCQVLPLHLRSFAVRIALWRCRSRVGLLTEHTSQKHIAGVFCVRARYESSAHLKQPERHNEKEDHL